MQANTLQRQLFYVPSFKIYGSVAGFYDYGPPGCAVKQNITQFWRQHFVLEENMLEARARLQAHRDPSPADVRASSMNIAHAYVCIPYLETRWRQWRPGHGRQRRGCNWRQRPADRPGQRKSRRREPLMKQRGHDP